MTVLSLEEVEGLVRQGVHAAEEVDASELREGATLEIRPLTRGEASRVRTLSTKGQRVSASPDRKSISSLDIDLSQAGKAAEESETLLVAYGLSVNEKWTPAQVERLPETLVARLVKEIKRISGEVVDIEATMRQFREQQSGEDAEDGD